MKFIFSLLALLITASPSAQTHIEIRGSVLDQKSKEPLPYANISIKNSSLGTVSNEQGVFKFFVPIDLKNDSLMVSYIGYKTFKESISDLRGSKNIYLEESPTLLKEVSVSSESARKLIEEAQKAVPLVYPTTPYLMEGFHRSWERVDFTDSISYPGTLVEAAITIYDPGYGQKKSGGKEQVYINEVRRSAIMKGWDYDGNTLRDLLNKNLVKYNRALPFIFIMSFMDFPNNLVYQWEGATEINDENLSIVKIEIPNTKKFPAFYRVYISEEDHAILRFDLCGEKKEIDYAQGSWHTEKLSKMYIFKRYQNRPYLSYVKVQYTIKNLDLVKKTVLRTEDYYRELLVNKVITRNVESHRKSLSSQKSKEVSLALQTKEYNEAFWKSYNVIQDNPLDKEIIQYFNQKQTKGDPFKAGKKDKKD